LDALRHRLLDLEDGDADRVLQRDDVSAAVAFHHDTTQTDEARAVVARRVDAIAEAVQHGTRDRARELRGEIALEFLAQETRDHAAEALGGLQRDVTGEAV